MQKTVKTKPVKTPKSSVKNKTVVPVDASQTQITDFLNILKKSDSEKFKEPEKLLHDKPAISIDFRTKNIAPDSPTKQDLHHSLVPPVVKDIRSNIVMPVNTLLSSPTKPKVRSANSSPAKFLVPAVHSNKQSDRFAKALLEHRLKLGMYFD